MAMNAQIASSDPLQVAQRFFAAIEKGEIDIVASLYHPKAVIWHNFTQKEITPAQNLETLMGFVRRAPTRRYANPRLLTTPRGFVQQHVLEAVRIDGRKLSLPACVVVEVEDGRITRIDEYFDTQPLNGWFDVG
jgi:ketosteroid isomerase-like protein